MNTHKTHHAFPHSSPEASSHSEIPAAGMPPVVEQVVPGPGAAGGLDNIPESLLEAAEAMVDEMDHAGLDTVLPNEDQTPAESQDSVAPHPETWGKI